MYSAASWPKPWWPFLHQLYLTKCATADDLDHIEIVRLQPTVDGHFGRFLICFERKRVGLYYINGPLMLRKIKRIACQNDSSR